MKNLLMVTAISAGIAAQGLANAIPMIIPAPVEVKTGDADFQLSSDLCEELNHDRQTDAVAVRLAGIRIRAMRLENPFDILIVDTPARI